MHELNRWLDERPLRFQFLASKMSNLSSRRAGCRILATACAPLKNTPVTARSLTVAVLKRHGARSAMFLQRGFYRIRLSSTCLNPAGTAKTESSNPPAASLVSSVVNSI